MYNITIKTKYNVINLTNVDIHDPKIQEILEQPYIIETKIEEVKDVGKQDSETNIVLSKKK